MYPLFIDFSGKPPLSTLTVVQTLTSIGLIISYISLVGIHTTRASLQPKWKILFLLFCLFTSFAFIISLGRISVRGMERILVENSYYHYFFWAFFIIFIYVLIPFEHLKNGSETILPTIFTALLIILIVFNCRLTYTLVSKQSRKAAFHRQLNKQIQTLIKQHAGEKDLSFGLDPSIDKDTYLLLWAKRSNEPEDKSYDYFKLLYPEYYRERHPKYMYSPDKNKKWGWRKTGS